MVSKLRLAAITPDNEFTLYRAHARTGMHEARLSRYGRGSQPVKILGTRRAPGERLRAYWGLLMAICECSGRMGVRATGA